jgi:hypothetical protein
MGMDLQQSPCDVLASHNGALVVVGQLRRLALDHQMDPRHHHLQHCLILWHLDRHRLLL